MRFVTRPALPAVSACVRELWLLEDDGALHAGLPKPYVELVVSLAGRHFWRAEPDGAEHLYDHGWVTPLQSAPRHARSVGPRRLIGARLQPWAAVAMFGRLPEGDGSPPPRLVDLIGDEADTLRGAVLAASDDEGAFAAFQAWLEGRPELRASAPDFDDVSGLRAFQLASRAGLSARSLRRRFAADLGVSPKQWLRLHRLDRLLRDRDLRTTDEALAQLAQAHGFADQAHMTREVVALTGVTPRGLRRNPAEAPPHLLAGD